MATINQSNNFVHDDNNDDFLHQGAVPSRYIIRSAENKFIRDRIFGCLGRNFIPRFWSSLESDFTYKFGKDRTEKILTSERMRSLKKSVSPTIKKSINVGPKNLRLSKKSIEQSKDDIARVKLENQISEKLRLGLKKRKDLVSNLTTLLNEATILLTNNF